jgi:hypothetical protein
VAGAGAGATHHRNAIFETPFYLPADGPTSAEPVYVEPVPAYGPALGPAASSWAPGLYAAPLSNDGPQDHYARIEEHSGDATYEKPVSAWDGGMYRIPNGLRVVGERTPDGLRVGERGDGAGAGHEYDMPLAIGAVPGGQQPPDVAAESFL